MADTNGFLEQTAKDYDLPLWVVEKAKKQYPNNFYNRLEEILADRHNE